MNEKFKQLNPEKKERILNAAYDEFAEKGYKNASTNVIAKNAGIGKGTLFNYFGTKENLFHYLIEYGFNTLKREYLDKIDYNETDFFERMNKTGQLKWKVYFKYEALGSFMANVFMHLEEYDLPDELKNKREIAEGVWTRTLTENIDFSKFREDIPVETSLNLIMWTMQGYRAELEQKFKMMDQIEMSKDSIGPYYDEYYHYLKLLKKIYYKPEYIEE